MPRSGTGPGTADVRWPLPNRPVLWVRVRSVRRRCCGAGVAFPNALHRTAEVLQGPRAPGSWGYAWGRCRCVQYVLRQGTASSAPAAVCSRMPCTDIALGSYFGSGAVLFDVSPCSGWPREFAGLVCWGFEAGSDTWWCVRGGGGDEVGGGWTMVPVV